MVKNEVVVVSGVRTAVGDFGGSLKNILRHNFLRLWSGKLFPGLALMLKLLGIV